MSAKVAHEIKNPLTALKSLLQLERANAKDERSQKRFEVMTSEVARIEAIVRDYLSQAKPLGVMAIGDVDLARLADDVISVLEGRAGDAGVELRRDGRGAVVPGDERRLKEAVLNLGQNAVEATPSGGTVTISVDATADAARIVVRDTGHGIAASVRGRLGTSFVTTRAEGTGLGLAIARGIIKQHQGTLEIENRPEGGAVATVILPLRPAPKETHGADPSG
jgi:signal transduction histidine kinase